MTIPNGDETLHENEKKLLCFVESRSFTSVFTLEQSLRNADASFHTSYPSTSVLFYSSRNL